MFHQKVEAAATTRCWTVTVFTASGGYQPWARVERVYSYRWRWQAQLRSMESFKQSYEPHLIRRWKRDPIELGRWSEITPTASY